MHYSHFQFGVHTKRKDAHQPIYWTQHNDDLSIASNCWLNQISYWRAHDDIINRIIRASRDQSSDMTSTTIDQRLQCIKPIQNPLCETIWYIQNQRNIKTPAWIKTDYTDTEMDRDVIFYIKLLKYLCKLRPHVSLHRSIQEWSSTGRRLNNRMTCNTELSNTDRAAKRPMTLN